MALGGFTQVQGSIFEIKEKSTYPYEVFDDVHMVISFEFDQNYYRIDRSTYNSLDWLGDIGGLE